MEVLFTVIRKIIANSSIVLPLMPQPLMIPQSSQLRRIFSEVTWTRMNAKLVLALLGVHPKRSVFVSLKKNAG